MPLDNMTNGDITPEQREEFRQAQLRLIGSEALQNMYAGAHIYSSNNFGGYLKKSTQGLWNDHLEHPTGEVSELIYDTLHESRNGEMIAGHFTEMQLAQKIKTFYNTGLAALKVSDLLEFTNTTDNAAGLTDEQKEMYIPEYAESGDAGALAVGKLMGNYRNQLIRKGIGRALDLQGTEEQGQLEAILANPQEALDATNPQR